MPSRLSLRTWPRPSAFVFLSTANARPWPVITIVMGTPVRTGEWPILLSQVSADSAASMVFQVTAP